MTGTEWKASQYRAAATLSAALTACLLSTVAHAAPEEVQVYMDEINPARTPGLDLHLNDVITGRAGADYPGGETALHDFRITPEFSLGLGNGFEAGLYLPLATLSEGVLRAQGAKARIKWIAPHAPDSPFYWGANFEIGRVAYRLDQNPWNAEIKGIAGWRRGKWNVALNGNFDFVVSGPVPSPATFELASKINYLVAPDVAFGVESYNGLGDLKYPALVQRNEQSSYLTIDTRIGKWDINAGIGRGYGANPDRLIVKFVLGVPLPR
ncbi:hypothetical protein [Novosphingobium sp.]|uniref:hypothetical protein n=1 Tax=Novosphingobium sp. TaxID=1874826 RepID=UPI003B5296E2